MKHTDVCTLYSNEEDRDILTRKLFDVNLRLYKSSSPYREIVRDCAGYIWWCAQTEKKGYKKPHGFSGANGGIPFNIIATPEKVMLNPHILDNHGGQVRHGESNCGSLLLTKPIEVWRWAKITFEYWDLGGNRHVETGYLPTIQHEIDHNNGILILDRKREG